MMVILQYTTRSDKIQCDNKMRSDCTEGIMYTSKFYS